MLPFTQQLSAHTTLLLHQRPYNMHRDHVRNGCGVPGLDNTGTVVVLGAGDLNCSCSCQATPWGPERPSCNSLRTGIGPCLALMPGL